MYSQTYLAGSVQYKFFYYQQLFLLLLLVAISIQQANRRRSWRNTTIINYQIESFKMRSWTGGNDYLIVHVTCSFCGIYVHYRIAFLGSFVNKYLRLDTFLVFINMHFMFTCIKYCIRKKVITENKLLHCDLSSKCIHGTCSQ